MSNAAGTGEWDEGDPFTAVQSRDYYKSGYWSGLTVAGSTGFAWYVLLRSGEVSYGDKAYTFYVWPVRGGE